MCVCVCVCVCVCMCVHMYLDMYRCTMYLDGFLYSWFSGCNTVVSCQSATSY